MEATPETPGYGMSPLTDEQEKQLAAPLAGEHVRTKQGKFSYIEGHHAIREMNRIFGPTGWSRETMIMEEVSRGDFTKDGKIGVEVGYVAKVRVVAGGAVKEGTGFGSAVTYQQTVADAIESATKEAETDAMKRACMMFGDPLGLALYDTQKTHVEGAGDGPPASAGQAAAPAASSHPSTQDGEFAPCPDCGRELQRRNGKKGEFVGCTGYPTCKFTSNIDKAPRPNGGFARADAPPAAAPAPAGPPPAAVAHQSGPGYSADEEDPFDDDAPEQGSAQPLAMQPEAEAPQGDVVSGYDASGYPVQAALLPRWMETTLGIETTEARQAIRLMAIDQLWGGAVQIDKLTPAHVVALAQQIEALTPPKAEEG